MISYAVFCLKKKNKIHILSLIKKKKSNEKKGKSTIIRIIYVKALRNKVDD